MKTYTLYKADNPEKKYKVYVKSNNAIKKIEFGQAGASDFTKHRNKERRQLYINRHYKNEDWEDYTTPGFWAYRILWNKTTLQASYNDTLKKFKLTPETIGIINFH